MKLLDDIRDFFQYSDDDTYEDYNNNDVNDYYTYNDDMIVGEVQTVMKGDPIPELSFERGKITEEERKHCLKLYEMATAFDKLDAATVMCVLCQNHMDVVMSAIMNEISEMRDTINKYKEVGK